jgi:predicted metal-binding membrane protein
MTNAFLGVMTLIFVASAAVTIAWCGSMSDMGGMTMPGGWTMSMTWMRMPGQTWPGAAASFLGMWIVMMIAMMLPSLTPMLLRYREAVVGTGDANPSLGRLTAIVGVGYFFIWTLLGIVIYPVGIAIAEIEMRHLAVSEVVPFAAGMAILIAGLFQFTPWKARYLARCREIPGLGRTGTSARTRTRTRTLPGDAATAWRHGLRLGLHCSYACAGPMMILLVLGVMDLRAMAVVTAAITLERFAPASHAVARGIGVVTVAAGLFLMIQNLADLI